MRQNPQTRTWLLLALGGVLLWVLAKKGVPGLPGAFGPPTSSGSGANMTFNVPGFTPQRGGDPRWGETLIGSSSKRINQVGCLVTVMSMACNRLRGTSLTPADVVAIGNRNPGCFSGANTNTVNMAAALGLSSPVRGRVFGDASRSQLRDCIDSALAAGGVVSLHVDYNRDQTGTLEGDHFVLCIGRVDIPEQGPTYLCADPLKGTVRPIFADTLTGPAFSGKTYLVVGAAPIYRA